MEAGGEAALGLAWLAEKWLEQPPHLGAAIFGLGGIHRAETKREDKRDAR